ncbi:MAG: GerMN domain-containing protein [Actinobacteria bacterium]|nr:GerMN domain-containing protein [Actinomycetota bacterium]
MKVINKIARVDLSQSFMDDRFVSDTVDILLIYSIVNTLTEFKEVEAVDFYIDGVKLDIFGQLSVEEPIYRRSDLIKN